MKISNKSGMSIIEVIVAIFIFTMGLASIYLVIASSLNLNEYGKNQIIASNLAREGLELVNNLRDSNYANLHDWDLLNPNLEDDFESNKIQTGIYYKIEIDNNTVYPNFSVKLTKIDNFKEGKNYIEGEMQNYELCLDLEKRYTYYCVGNRKSKFFRYIKFEDLKYKDSLGNERIVTGAYKVISKVIWYKKGYHEINLTTILADYKKL